MKKILFILCCLGCLLMTAQAQQNLVGGEYFRQGMVPAQLNLTMRVGEEKVFSLEENLSQRSLWTLRPYNNELQTVVTHQLVEVTGNLQPVSGTATVKIIGNVVGTIPVDLALVQMANPSIPVSVVKLFVTVVPAAPAPGVIIPPPPPPKPNIPAVRPFSFEPGKYYTMGELGPNAEIRMRAHGDEIIFYLENNRKDGYEWNARFDDDYLNVHIDNDRQQDVHLHGHKNNRTVNCTSVDISSFKRGETRLVLEYSKSHHGRPGKPEKVISCKIIIF